MSGETFTYDLSTAFHFGVLSGIVFTVLKRECDRQGTDSVFLSRDTIHEKTGMRMDEMMEGLDELIRCRFIERVYTPSNTAAFWDDSNDSFRYRIHPNLMEFQV